MRKGVLACAIVSVVVGSPGSFTIEQSFHLQKTSIAGKISPQTGADIVKVIGMKDSVNVAVIDGNFIAQVKPGRYKLIITTKAPFKNALLDNLEVRQNQVLNVGEIILQ